jgi:hypothetical protein
MYIYIYIYILYVYLHLYVYICICMNIHVYTSIYTCMCMQICSYIYSLLYVYTYTNRIWRKLDRKSSHYVLVNLIIRYLYNNNNNNNNLLKNPDLKVLWTLHVQRNTFKNGFSHPVTFIFSGFTTANYTTNIHTYTYWLIDLYK